MSKQGGEEESKHNKGDNEGERQQQQEQQMIKNSIRLSDTESLFRVSNLIL